MTQMTLDFFYFNAHILTATKHSDDFNRFLSLDVEHDVVREILYQLCP